MKKTPKPGKLFCVIACESNQEEDPYEIPSAPVIYYIECSNEGKAYKAAKKLLKEDYDGDSFSILVEEINSDNIIKVK